MTTEQAKKELVKRYKYLYENAQFFRALHLVQETQEKTPIEKIKKFIFIFIIILITAFFGFALVFILQGNHRRKKE